MSTSRSPRLWPYLVFGLLAYLLFLATATPAAQAYPRLQQRLGLPAIGTLSGSLFEGRGHALKLQTLTLDEVSWSFRPGRLLLGQLSFDTQARSTVLGRLNGTLGLGLGGQLSASALTGRTSADALATRFSGQSGLLQGQVELKLQQLLLDGQRIADLSGEVIWHDAALIQPQAAALGELRLSLSHSEKGIKGILSDGGGPLKADGELLIGADGQYRLNATLLARNNNDKALRNALAWLGRADAQGRVKVDLKGRVPGWPAAAS